MTPFYSKTPNRTSKVIRRELYEDLTLTDRKMKENKPVLLHDVSVIRISDHLVKDLQYRS